MKTSLLAVSLGALVAVTAMPGQAQADTIETERHDVQLNTITNGLENPWGMTFISNNEVLVTERPGRLRRVSLDGTVSEPLSGVPAVDARNQGGLLDVVVDRILRITAMFTLVMLNPTQTTTKKTAPQWLVRNLMVIR